MYFNLEKVKMRVPGVVCLASVVYSIGLWLIVFLSVSAGSPGNTVSVQALWDGSVGVCLEAL